MIKTIAQRVDEHTHVPTEKIVPHPPFPDAIKIEITARCNYSCSFCATKRSKRPLGDIDKEFLFRILHEAKSIGVKEIGMFLLGESLLCKDLPEYIRYAKENAGIEYIFLTTNGSLCTPRRVTPLVEAGLDSIKFSMNAGSKERYKEIHGVDKFDEVISNIKWLKKFRTSRKLQTPRISVSSIYMNEHKPHIV
ncbi:MAG: radical SAM protein [Lentisphaerae bacterium]|nr:radical SAM protein [Lentisphaerota bacterium]